MRTTALCLVFCMAASTAAAEFAAHEHGVAGMNIGVEGKDIHITFTPTGHDVMGFEHKPETDKEKAAALAAKRTLEDGLKLFGVPEAAKCKVEYTEVTSGLFHFAEDDDHDHAAGEKEEHDDHAHGKDDHDDHAHGKKDHDDQAHDKDEHDGHAHDKKDHDKHAHDKDDHDDHAHEKKEHDERAHDHDGHGEEAHDDVLAKYHFVCANPAALDALEMTYFKAFPLAETVKVNAITDAGQYSVSLTREAPRLDLKRN